MFLYYFDLALRSFRSASGLTVLMVLTIAMGIGANQVRATREAVAAAQASLGATRVGREMDNRSQTDVLNAIQRLTQAQAALAQARHQFILARLQLQQAAGALTEADLARVNSLAH